MWLLKSLLKRLSNSSLSKNVNSNERVRLAQELHDGIAQDLVGLGYRCDALIAAIGVSNEIRSELRTMRFALTDLVEKVRIEIFELRSSPSTAVSRSPVESEMNFELERIFSEIVRNAQAHSKATKLLITVADNGAGGVLEKVGHHGLTGVKERVQNLNGELSIDSGKGGTTFHLSIPLVTL